MIVQIYEIQRPEEAERCIELGVDHVGSVLSNETEWRIPGLKETIRVSEGTPVKNSIIPLFQEIETLYRALDYYRPDLIHFCENLTDHHGREIDLGGFLQRQSQMKDKFPEVGIMRSIPIPLNGSDSRFPALTIARKLESVSDIFLTDTWLGKEPIDGFIGITGKRCDGTIAKALVLQSEIPVILAGGLSPENVYEALKEVVPAGADSCTQTNKVDKAGNPMRFRKDFERVEAFIEQVRKAEQDCEGGERAI
jgi:phosphoribosylanthranilate isomerase